MKLARYWTRASAEVPRPGAEPVRLSARGWSNESLDAARERAREIAARAAARVAAGTPERLQYEYGERPLPEPVIRTIPDPDGGPPAVITRNSYGALVLNAISLMFVDVDRKAPAAPRKTGILASLFGKPSAPSAPPPDPLIDFFRRVADRHALSVRIYETAAGYRLAITNVPFQPLSSGAETLMQEFECDPTYIRLCQQQESFRARLTPKPWRCGHYRLNVPFPLEDPIEEARYQRWESVYQAKSAGYATCRLVTTAGAQVVAPEFAELIRCHDTETASESGRPLA